MNRQEVIELCVAAAQNKPACNFTAEDVQKASVNAIIKYLGFEDGTLTGRDIRNHQTEIFSIIEETVDQVLPAKMSDILGQFAEVKTFGRDDQVKFAVERINRNRVKAAILPGARGGVYRARRLDNRDMYLETSVWSVGYNITLEDLLLGTHSIADVIAVITEGFQEKIYIEVVKALRALYSVGPSKNYATAAGDVVDKVGLEQVVRVIRAYGAPMIIGFDTLIDQLFNSAPDGGIAGSHSIMYYPNGSQEDIGEIRRNRHISMYKGTPVIALPNYFVDETNSQWYFKETDIFVLPTGAKPVKVAFQGESYTSEVDQPHGGKEWHLHKMVGTGILFNNNVGIYRQTGMSAGYDADGLY